MSEPPLQKELEQKAKLYTLLIRIAFAALVLFIAVTATLGVAKIVQVSNKVDKQTTFIVNYLHCIGQTPTTQRGPNATNSCFEQYAPKEVIK